MGHPALDGRETLGDTQGGDLALARTAGGAASRADYSGTLDGADLISPGYVLMHLTEAARMDG
ncbi:hypothetical protein, partial [Stenotrophomonas sp. SrG]|uniref:hypothetical protein n=1 Tax=Stenotrophomonas sp. SrG TaxID=3414430 RepID=UPI003CEAF431